MYTKRVGGRDAEQELVSRNAKLKRDAEQELVSATFLQAKKKTSQLREAMIDLKILG
jgi:hypothetical protein